MPGQALLCLHGGDARIRTGDKGFAGLCLATWRRRRLVAPRGPINDEGRFRCHAPSGPSPRRVEYGADDRIRTGDPNLGKVVLYQLSHVRAQRLV